jgi:hypothetical protein
MPLRWAKIHDEEGPQMEEGGKTCFDCAAYFPSVLNEPTEFGICLNEEVFDPVVELILEDRADDRCRELIEQNKFAGQRPACEDFEEAETIEIDDDSPLGREIARLRAEKRLNGEAFLDALLEEQFRSIDWSAVPVDREEAELQSPSQATRKAAVNSLAGKMSFGSSAAFDVLFNFFKGLPPPATVEEVHFKVYVLQHLNREEARETLLPLLIEELYRTPSSNTTRQWLSAILRFISRAPLELIQEPLEKMIKDKRFSYRYKKKMRMILEDAELSNLRRF